MKLTFTLVLLSCLLLLLLPASDAQRRYYRGRSGRGSGRALRRLAAAGLLFGAGTAFGVALARGRREAVPETSDLALAGEAVMAALQEADSQHCMEQWLCDITARPQDQRAEEERDLVLLFEEDAAAGLRGPPGSPRALYLAAAARGLAAADRSACQQPNCPRQPDQLLLQLRAAERNASL